MFKMYKLGVMETKRYRFVLGKLQAIVDHPGRSVYLHHFTLTEQNGNMSFSMPSILQHVSKATTQTLSAW